jgi:CyaY protein
MAARRGGYHYRHVDGRWIDREGGEFLQALSACTSEQAGRPLRFAVASSGERCPTDVPLCP